jgi:hypothetical protein
MALVAASLGPAGIKPTRRPRRARWALGKPTVGLARRRRNLQLQSMRSCLASDFVVLVLSEAVLSETVLVLDGCLNCGDADL